MYIHNQDRTKYIRFDGSLWTQELQFGDVSFGCNLMMDDEPLGTFDNLELAQIQMCWILYYAKHSDVDVYRVPGYSSGGFAEW